MNPNYPIHPENNQTKKYKSIVLEYFSADELKELLQKSNWKGAWAVAEVWLWIIGAFVISAVWTNVFTILLALVILGAKQLGCAIIMHDASHYSLFTSRKLNDVIGNWFGAYPIIHNVQQYRPYHLAHHQATGTDDDPDINLIKGYPTTKPSMARKFSRDIFGVSGFKGNYALLAMHLGYLKYSLGNYIERIVKEERGYMWQNAWKNLRGPIASNVIIFAICWLFEHPWLYFLWPAANLTTYMLILRIRSMAEHSMVKDRKDPLQSSRTIHPNVIEKVLFCPLNVNYHLEHHLLFTVPSYNFKKMHAKLWERGLYQKANYSEGYWNVIKMAMGRGSDQ